MKKVLLGVVLVFIFLLNLGCTEETNTKSKKESEFNSFKLSIAEDRIKNYLRDPESYKRVNYKVNYNGDKIESITIEYTAKNGLGGTNRESQTISF